MSSVAIENRAITGKRAAFTLVELLVVIGIIAVLIGILLPVISKARKQAVTVTCMANLRGVGQLLHIYASENKNSLPYGFYRSDAVQSSSENKIDDADPNTSLYIWWSVIRSYMRKGVNSDNGAANSANSISSRGMKGLTCPAGLSTDRGVSYAPNMVAMPDREWELGQHTTSGGNNPWPIGAPQPALSGQYPHVGRDRDPSDLRESVCRRLRDRWRQFLEPKVRVEALS